jgi:hypothetical protein
VVNTSPGISRSEVGRRGVAGGDGRKRPGSVSAIRETQLTSGARLTERRGRGGRLGRARTKKENAFPAKTRPTRGLECPAWTVLACGDGAASGLAGQRSSGPHGWPGRKQGKRISELKLDF